MSGNAPKGIDKRAARTRDRLGDALIEMVQERPFDEITVREVVARASVGRSTFYEHFRDTKDLFLSDADESLAKMATMLSTRGERSDRVAAVRELFEHVGENPELCRALLETDWVHQFLDLARAHFARGIARRLTEHPGAVAPDEAMAEALAGSLISMLTWWIHHGMPRPAAEMDAMFHRLVWNGVSP